jgi:decaprenylphospho-beta-D-ribofuranose 2-oxidase
LTRNAAPSLPLEHLARLENFGHSLSASAFVFQPNHIDQLRGLFDLARTHNFTVTARGSGRSYGDAALNSGQVVLDMRALNRVQSWDAHSGRIRVEPGVTIEQLWKHVLADGWWPPVVPGTMFPTLGGCLAANIHGKNNWQMGPLGEHVIEFDALLPNGKKVTCSPRKNKDLFYSMIGGMGMLGVFTSITLQLKPIDAGEMNVTAWTEPNLDAMLAAVDTHKEADYVVGWIDCSVTGRSLGRGQMHRAAYLHAADAANAQHSLHVETQGLPDRFFGLVPKGLLPRFMAPFTNNLGAKLVNTAKYIANATIGNRKTYRQSLVAFNFLLDYIPGWERIYGRGGLIQHQSFLPKEQSSAAFRAILERCQRRGLPAYLAVLKRHRPDKFLLSHAVDGYSLALDFRVPPRRRSALLALIAELDEIVLSAGGRFYFAKDSTLAPGSAERFLGAKTIRQFKQLKAKVDRNHLLESDLYRRVIGI